MTSNPGLDGTAQPVPLSSITVVAGFNPRNGVEEAELDALAESIRRRGVLQPVRLERVGEELLLVAGERRFAAAGRAGLTEIPAFIAAPGGDRPEGERLIDAVVENTHRVDITPYDEAMACLRLRREHRFSVKEIAAQLGLSQRKVTQRLKLSELPDDVQAHFASGALPLAAVEPLGAIAAVSPALAAACAALVTEAPADEDHDDGWGYGNRRWAPEELVAHPLSVAAHVATPEIGCYVVFSRYTLGDFDLPEQQAARASELPAYWQALSFNRADAEQAKSYGCLLGDPGAHAIICDRAFASDLAAKRLARSIKDWRREQRERARRDSAQATSQSGAVAAETVDERKERERGERLARKELGRSAVSHNDELGALLFKQLGAVIVDLDLLRLLTLIDFSDAVDFAARGLRYTHPGWKTVTTDAKGRERIEYLENQGAVAGKLREFLAGATSPRQWAGRMLQLLLASRLADARELPRSRQIGKPAPAVSGTAAAIAPDLAELLDRLADELIPEHLRRRAADATAAAECWQDRSGYRLPDDRASAAAEAAEPEPAEASAGARSELASAEAEEVGEIAVGEDEATADEARLVAAAT